MPPNADQIPDVRRPTDIFYLYAARIDRRSDPFDALFNACLVIAVMDPGAVEEISFQLSFAGYSAILLYLRS